MEPLVGSPSVLSTNDQNWPRRVDLARATSVVTSRHIEQLIALAEGGLAQMRAGDGFAFTVRRREGPDVALALEGDSLRYALIVALGLNQIDRATQGNILGGLTLRDFTLQAARRAETSNDLGCVALGAWAAAEVAGQSAGSLFSRLESAIGSDAPVDTVICAWALTAAVAGSGYHNTARLAATAARRLRTAQAKSGLFPHRVPMTAVPLLRRHIGCFADQVYPIQALARYSVAFADEGALSAANACAAAIVACQGPAGQWAWHYDTRDGNVVECYPVYSVHQHGMAPMALLDLFDAGGADHLAAVIEGVEWLYKHPEPCPNLIANHLGVVWRKIARREPAKAVRTLAATSTAIRPGLHLPGIEALFPPTQIDYECRPYELGWLLYAWRADTVVGKIRQAGRFAVPKVSNRPSSHAPAASLFGLRIDALRIEEVIDRCKRAVSTRKTMLLGVVNAAKVVNIRKDPALRGALNKCDMLLADGQSVVWASRLLGKPLPERVAGIDVFEDLLEVAHREDWSIYLLGARPEVLDALEKRLAFRFPGLRIAGCRHGYFSDDEGEAIAEQIRESRPDMLFLGMPSPKKEMFLAEFRDVLDVPVLHGVGGSFDVLAGQTKRAPLLWQRFGMEWAYRLMQEPRRMWRRYLQTNTAFIALTLKEMTRRNATPSGGADKQSKDSASLPAAASVEPKPEFRHG